MVLPSLEVAGAGGHWVEVSRAICPGEPSDDSKRMLEAYEEYYDARQTAIRDGATAHDVHRAVSKGFLDRGFKLGHVTGHSIGMTMIEFPKIGEGDETVLREGMILSMHPHAIARTAGPASTCRTRGSSPTEGGVAMADLPMRIFDGTEPMSRRGSSQPSSPARAPRTTSATCRPTRCSRCSGRPTSGCTATSCSS